jgi:hypothetical protein
MTRHHDSEVNDRPILAIRRPNSDPGPLRVIFAAQEAGQPANLIRHFSPTILSPFQGLRLAQKHLAWCFLFPSVKHFQGCFYSRCHLIFPIKQRPHQGKQLVIINRIA